MFSIFPGLCKICSSETVLQLHMTATHQIDADCDNGPTTTDSGIISFHEVDILWRSGISHNDKTATKARVQEMIRNQGKGTQ